MTLAKQLLLLFILFTARFGPPNGSMQAGVLLWEKLNEKTRSRATPERRRGSAIGAPQPRLMPCYSLPIKPSGRMSRTISLHIHLYHFSSCGNGWYPVVSSLL